jgi:hypothetical protein
MNSGSFQQVPGSGRDGNDSGNWPVLLVRRKKTLLVLPDLDAAWFGGAPSEPVDADEQLTTQLVSRRRLRLAHALFLLAFGAIVALLVWEARTHFSAGG